jgi:O-antigen/teichoic acid export membrane protein
VPSLRAVQHLRSLSHAATSRSLSVRASLNALAAALDYGARLVVGFLVNPLLVRGLGDYGYGTWQIMGRLVGYVGAASGRAPQALKWTIASRQSSADLEEKRRYVGSAIAVWFLFLPLLCSLGGLVGWFAPAWLDSPPDYARTIRLAVAVLVVDMLLTSLVALPRAVLEGENLGYKRMGWSALFVIIGGGLTALAVYLGTGLVGVAAAALAATLLMGVFFLQVARANVGWFGVARPSSAGVGRFLGLSGWFLLWRLVMRLMRASDVVVLGMLASVELVTTYSLTKYVPETVIHLVAVVVFGVTPGLGGIIGSGDLGRARRLRAEIMAFTWLVITVVGTTIVLWNQPFLGLWVGPQYNAGPLATLLIVLSVSQFVLIRNDASVIDLTLDLRLKVLLGMLSTTLSLVVAGVLVRVFGAGIVGLCLGYMTGHSVLSLSYPWLVGRALQIPSSYQLRGALRPGLVTILLLGAASSVHGQLGAGGWVGLGTQVAVTAGLVLVVAGYAGLTASQRAALIRRLRRAGGLGAGPSPPLEAQPW